MNATDQSARTYSEFVELLRSRLDAIDISMDQLDELAGLPRGYAGKVFGGCQTRRLGPITMWPMLQALGLKIHLTEDAELTAKMQSRYGGRQSRQARPNNHASPVSKRLMARVFRHFSRIGNRHRWRDKSPEQRREHARMMARRRWHPASQPKGSVIDGDV
jgi:hypothetical protein